jgi:hypothetical protein
MIMLLCGTEAYMNSRTEAFLAAVTEAMKSRPEWNFVRLQRGNIGFNLRASAKPKRKIGNTLGTIALRNEDRDELAILLGKLAETCGVRVQLQAYRGHDTLYYHVDPRHHS